MVVKAIDEPLKLPPSLANIDDPLASVTLHNPPTTAPSSSATQPATTQPATSQPATPATAPAAAATQPVALSAPGGGKEGAR